MKDPLRRPAAELERLAAEAFPPELWVDRTVLVAVSGGADSTALARALAALRERAAAEGAFRGRLVLAHFHHGLRGAEADGDRSFVAELARELGCCFVTEQAPAAAGEAPAQAAPGGEAADDPRADDPLAGFSEGLGRAQRYDFLLRAGKEHGARYVATGHTADDQAETILHHILRGSGLEGLAGMPAVRDLGELTLVRPFLRAGREAVREYLFALGATFREDGTNVDRRFLRNRIRCDLLPLLERDYRPDVRGALLRLAAAAADANSLAEEAAAPLWAAVQRVDPQGRSPSESGAGLQFERRPFASAPRAAALQVLRAAWKRMGWSASEMRRRHWERLLAMLASDARGDAVPWKQQFPAGVDALRDARRLWLAPRAARPRDDG